MTRKTELNATNYEFDAVSHVCFQYGILLGFESGHELAILDNFTLDDGQDSVKRINPEDAVDVAASLVRLLHLDVLSATSWEDGRFVIVLSGNIVITVVPRYEYEAWHLMENGQLIDVG